MQYLRIPAQNKLNSRYIRGVLSSNGLVILYVCENVLAFLLTFVSSAWYLTTHRREQIVWIRIFNLMLLIFIPVRGSQWRCALNLLNKGLTYRSYDLSHFTAPYLAWWGSAVVCWQVVRSGNVCGHTLVLLVRYDIYRIRCMKKNPQEIFHTRRVLGRLHGSLHGRLTYVCSLPILSSVFACRDTWRLADLRFLFLCACRTRVELPSYSVLTVVIYKGQSRGIDHSFAGKRQQVKPPLW